MVMAHITATTTPMIQVRGLRKSFRDRVAVDNIGLDIHRGETLGLLGPNGAGKTTTIHMMTGILKPDAGEIRVDGRPDPTRADVRRRIGLSPQSLAIYEDLTAEENLFFFGRLYGLDKQALRNRVGELLELAGLADRRRDYVRVFSGGMKRRMNMAAALVHSPEVLFLDEPTVGVDPQSRNHLFESVMALARSGTTVVYTTHYMEEAERLCDRVAIIDQGKILAIDTVDQLKRKHGGDATIILELHSEPSVRERMATTFSSCFPDRDITKTESQWSLATSDPLRDLARLSATEIDPASIALERPHLESVFLNLTGRRLRDE